MTQDGVTSREMRAIEMNAEYLGISPGQLMENAGGAVASDVARRFKAGDGKVVALVGTGGNGGDGMVAARRLACMGYDVQVVLIGDAARIKRRVVRQNWDVLQVMDRTVETCSHRDSTEVPPVRGMVVLDALLGTGYSGPLNPPLLQAVRRINECDGFTVAVDVPTGLDADTGQVVNDAVKADLTITFHRSKVGLATGTAYTGDIVVADIGIPTEATTYIGPGDVVLTRTPRDAQSHKGDHGRLLIVGGSETYSGAPALAALAALRVGVDLTCIAAPEETAHDIAAMSPELITVKLEGDHLKPGHVAVLRPWIRKTSGVIVGPGLGVHSETTTAIHDLVKQISTRNVPLLLDADGLKAFAETNQRATTPTVMTPHAAEYAVLTGKPLPDTLEDRIAHVRTTAGALHAVIVLKGAIDVISDGTRVKLNKFAHNPGMTTGGTGDVLSGIVGALLAQGCDPFRASASGTFINGAAGDMVAAVKGHHLLPTDIIERVPQVMENPLSHAAFRSKATPANR
jgi:NAD(P)H-hydrate epimerase